MIFHETTIRGARYRARIDAESWGLDRWTGHGWQYIPAMTRAEAARFPKLAAKWAQGLWERQRIAEQAVSEVLAGF